MDKSKPMMGAAGRIATEAGESKQHERGEKRPARAAGVGNETKVSGSALGEAVRELERQHPIKYDDLGPHHNRSDHVRHAPGIRPNNSHPFGRSR